MTDFEQKLFLERYANRETEATDRRRRWKARRDSQTYLKPWPSEAAPEYFRMKEHASLILKHATEMIEVGLNGPRAPQALKTLIPICGTLAEMIQGECSSYNAKRSKGFARWAGWSVEDIEDLTGAIKLAMEDAFNAFHNQPRNIKAVDFCVQETLRYAAEIITLLKAGPPPETAITWDEYVASNGRDE